MNCDYIIRRSHPSTEEVAEFLDVDPRSVRRWFSGFRRSGAQGLRAGPVSGRPPKLSTTQEKIVLRWLSDHPAGPGGATKRSASASIRGIFPPGCGLVVSPPRSPSGSPANATRRRSPNGSRPSGRASKKGPTPGGLPRLDRRERPDDGPAGSSHLGAAGPDAGVGPRGREAPKGL